MSSLDSLAYGGTQVYKHLGIQAFLESIMTRNETCLLTNEVPLPRTFKYHSFHRRQSLPQSCPQSVPNVIIIWHNELCFNGKLA